MSRRVRRDPVASHLVGELSWTPLQVRVPSHLEVRLAVGSHVIAGSTCKHVASAPQNAAALAAWLISDHHITFGTFVSIPFIGIMRGLHGRVVCPPSTHARELIMRARELIIRPHAPQFGAAYGSA